MERLNIECPDTTFEMMIGQIKMSWDYYLCETQVSNYYCGSNIIESLPSTCCLYPTIEERCK